MMNEVLEEAKQVFEIEAQAIQQLEKRLNEDFTAAIHLLEKCEGKVIVTGMGKSGLIGRKIAATLSSTGTPSFFLHPAESSHGDLGVVTDKDVVLAISYGGESEELNSIFQYCKRKGIALIAMTSRKDSSLGRAGDCFIDVSIEKEACPLGLAPTTSTTVTLAMGDALAVALMKAKGIQKENFAEYHPGGKLGRRLLTKVSDVMHTEESFPLVNIKTSMKDVLAKMTQREVKGVAGVIDDQGFLVGVITDGDIRRNVESLTEFLGKTAEEVMSTHPKTIDQGEMAEKALFVMEQFQIQTLFAVDGESSPNSPQLFKPAGLLHIQDLLRAKIC